MSLRIDGKKSLMAYVQQFDLEALPCLETIEIRTQNLSNIIKNHKAHTDTYLNPERQTRHLPVFRLRFKIFL